MKWVYPMGLDFVYVMVLDLNLDLVEVVMCIHVCSFHVAIVWCIRYSSELGTVF